MELKDWIDSIIAVIALIAFIASCATLYITRKHLLWERVHRIHERLYELDKVLIEHPEIQKVLFNYADHSGTYFTAQTIHDDDYFRVKAYIYMQLNHFDEITDIVMGHTALEKAMEFEDWANYILKRMQHPLFRELYYQDTKIFGDKLEKFLKSRDKGIQELSRSLLK
jgi:hypothetical protein